MTVRIGPAFALVALLLFGASAVGSAAAADPADDAAPVATCGQDFVGELPPELDATPPGEDAETLTMTDLWVCGSSTPTPTPTTPTTLPTTLPPTTPPPSTPPPTTAAPTTPLPTATWRMVLAADETELDVLAGRLQSSWVFTTDENNRKQVKITSTVIAADGFELVDFTAKYAVEIYKNQDDVVPTKTIFIIIDVARDNKVPNTMRTYSKAGQSSLAAADLPANQLVKVNLLTAFSKGSVVDKDKKTKELKPKNQDVTPIGEGRKS
jgi:hypothetical protein